MSSETTRWWLIAAQAALVVVATTVVFIPEARSMPMRVATLALALVNATTIFVRDWRSGVLPMSVPQIFKAYRKGGRLLAPTLLEFAASTLGAIAVVVVIAF